MTITHTITAIPSATLMKRLRKICVRPVPDRRCSCRDKRGHLKKLYGSYSEAADVASARSGACRKWLNIYKCPEKLGWHITSNIHQW